MPRLTKLEARNILDSCHAWPAQDFHALRSDIVELLLREAKARGYREPKNANGSRGRYFHAYLVRAAMKPKSWCSERGRYQRKRL